MCVSVIPIGTKGYVGYIMYLQDLGYFSSLVNSKPIAN